MLCTLIGAIILSINIQVGLNMHHMMTSGMHRRPFEGRHLVKLFKCLLLAVKFIIKNMNYLKAFILTVKFLSKS